MVVEKRQLAIEPKCQAGVAKKNYRFMWLAQLLAYKGAFKVKIRVIKLAKSREVHSFSDC